MTYLLEIPDCYIEPFESATLDVSIYVNKGKVTSVGGLPVKEFNEPTEEQKWIPVSERLPEAGEYVGDVAKYYLVQTEYGDMMVARYTHSGYWEQIYQLNPIGDKIVAWMPLPKLYEGVEMDE